LALVIASGIVPQFIAKTLDGLSRGAFAGVDMAGGNKRTDYVAVSNTAIGFALLAVGGLSGLASLISAETALALLGAMGVAGVVSTHRLREA
jgi:hypothetical protein